MLAFYSEELLDPAQPPRWKTTCCQLSTTALSVYLQLSSTYGSLLLLLKLDSVQFCMNDDKGPT